MKWEEKRISDVAGERSRGERKTRTERPLVVSYHHKSYITVKQHVIVETHITQACQTYSMEQKKKKKKLHNIVSTHSKPIPLMGEGQRENVQWRQQ